MFYENLNILGLMSGTSMDGIDCSLLRTNGLTFKRLKKNLLHSYKNETLLLINKVIKEPYENIKLEDKLFLEQCITEDHAIAVSEFKKKYNSEVNLIGFHGQTIFHNPKNYVSIQIGNGQILANLTKTKVISNFRENDLLHKGQGAPLAPVYHKAIMQQENLTLPACFINIGGVCNLTWWDGQEILAFDSGPGNGLIDIYMQKKLNLKYDYEGEKAFRGRVNKNVKYKFFKNNFFSLTPPKSLDRNEFIKTLEEQTLESLSVNDAVATLSSLTIGSIIKGYKYFKLIPKITVVMGGGQHNKYIISELKKNLPGKVVTANEINLPGDFIEAELIAYLAARRLYNLPITYPKTTGVKSPTTGGIINNII